MYFTLGVLIATLVALLVLPAVWHRAVRLTTKRVEAAVPISIFEVQADKDQQRAFFALNQRRLELQGDAMRDTIVAHAATIETQRQKVFELEGALKELQDRHAFATATGAERDVLLGETQDQLSDRTAALARTEEELAARVAALTALEEAHRILDGQAHELAAMLKTREATLVTERERIAGLEAQAASLAARLEATTRRLEETAAALEAEQKAAAEGRILAAETATRLTADLAETQSALTRRSGESETRAGAITALEAERDRLAATLATAEQDLEASRSVVHAFEQRRATEFAAAEAENRRLADTLHMLRADHALMEENVRRTGRDGAAASPAAGPTLAPEGAAALRDSISDVAARLVALTARLEGPASPLRTLVDGAQADGLAGRIRALLDAAPDGNAQGSDQVSDLDGDQDEAFPAGDAEGLPAEDVASENSESPPRKAAAARKARSRAAAG